MPVLLKGKEVDLTRKEQLNTLNNLNLPYNFIQSRIDQLNLKSEKIRNKLQSALVVYRRIVNSIYNKSRTRKNNCNVMGEIDKININLEKPEFVVEEKRNEIILYLMELKNSIHNLISKVDKDLYEYERKMFVYRNINKIN